MVTVTTNAAAELECLLSESAADARLREATRYDRASGGRVRPIVLFGAGGLGQRTLAGLRADGVEPVAFVDNNSARWGTSIEGVPVLSPADAAAAHGRSATFVITIWGAGSPHRLAHSVEQLRSLGCVTIVPIAWLSWKHPERLLPHYGMHLPSRLLAQTAAVREAFGLLADERSRVEFVEQVRFRLTGDPGCLDHPVEGPQYLVTDVVDPIEGEVVLDCGAYDGDTLAEWLQVRGPSFARYIAMEPDPDSRDRLKHMVTELGEVGDRIVVLPYAASVQPGTATFSAMGSVSSFLGNAGDGVRVMCARIDDVLTELGGPAPTFLKMDIEGAELGALTGAAGLIREHAPVIAVSAYHRQDHLWRVLLTIAAIRPDYRFFLRPHNEEGWDLVLYAVPPHRHSDAAGDQ